MKIIICLFLTFLCYSCSTIKTISPNNNHINISAYGKRSVCESIPRIYSGVSHSICSPGKSSEEDTLNGTPVSLVYFCIDTSFSFAADTIFLPFTIYNQFDKGNIKVN